MPRGKEVRIPLADLRWAAERHAEGWSLRFISRARWREWGYASANSANEALRRSLAYVGGEVRSQAEATALVHTVHGNLRKGFANPEHPEHHRYLEHRRHARQQREEARR